MRRRLAAVLLFCLAFNPKAGALPQDQPGDSPPAGRPTSDIKQDLKTSFDKTTQAYLKGDPIGQKLPESALEKLQKEITPQDAESAVKLKELKELRSQVLAVQSGREPSEDSQIYRASIEVLANKLHVDHEPVLQLYGERVRSRPAGNAASSSGAPEANGEAPPTEEQIKLKEEATQRLLQDSQLTPERRTELSQKADEYARQLGSLSSTNGLGNTANDLAVDAGRLPKGPLTEADFRRLNAQAKQDYVKIKRATDPPVPKDLAVDPNSSKLASALKNKFGSDGLPPILPWSAGGAAAGALIGLYATRKKQDGQGALVASLAAMGAVSGALVYQSAVVPKHQPIVTNQLSSLNRTQIQPKDIPSASAGTNNKSENNDFGQTNPAGSIKSEHPQNQHTAKDDLNEIPNGIENIRTKAKKLAKLSGKSVCAILAEWYQRAKRAGDSQKAESIKTAQKFEGCRRTHLD